MHLALACENYLHLWVNRHNFMRLFINDQLNVFRGPQLNLGDDAKMNALVNPCERPATMFWRQWAGFLHACEAAQSDRLHVINFRLPTFYPSPIHARSFGYKIFDSQFALAALVALMLHSLITSCNNVALEHKLHSCCTSFAYKQAGMRRLAK